MGRLTAYSDTISIEDSTGVIIGVIICDVIKNIPSINVIVMQVQAIIPGALEYDYSRRPDYKYTAFHGQIYNRFSQWVSRVAMPIASLTEKTGKRCTDWYSSA